MTNRRTHHRRWVAPPAAWQAGEPFEGAAILDEVPGADGLVLWQAVRDALLWGAASASRGAALFTPDARAARLAALGRSALPEHARSDLRELAGMLAAQPVPSADDMMAAALRVSAWARDAGALRTAHAFAVAAARIEPRHPGAALEIGRLALASGDPVSAAAWFRRTVGLARRNPAWDAYADAYLGLAAVADRTGDPAAVRAHLVKCLRVSRRHALWERTGAARHQLLCLAAADGDEPAVSVHARAALRAYGRRHPVVARLTLDLAAFWVRRGLYSPAHRVLQAVATRLRDPRDADPPLRLRGWTLAALAAAGVGDEAAFGRGWDRAWDALDGLGPSPDTVATLLDLALAATLIGDWPRARGAALAAQARVPSEAETHREVLALLDDARRRRHRLPPARSEADAEGVATIFARNA